MGDFKRCEGLFLKHPYDLSDAPELALVRDGPAITAVWAENEGGYSRHLRDCAWRAILVNRHDCSGMANLCFILH